LTAAVEGGMELCRTRGSGDCTLEIAHKDLEIDTKHALRQDPSCGWRFLGEAKAVLLSEERQAVIDLLLEAGKPMHYKAIAADIRKKEGTAKKLVWEMARDHQLIPTGGGNYEIAPTMFASRPPHETSVTGNQNNQSNQGNCRNQVTGDNGYRGSRRLRSGSNQVTDDKHREISPMGTRLPRLPEIDESCTTDNDRDAAEVFYTDSGDYIPRRPDAPSKVLDVDVALEMAAAPEPPVSPVDDRYADALGKQVHHTEEEMF
jgi:hypothetical protein